MTTTDNRPDVVAVLRAVDKGALLPLLPREEAGLLAGPVARAVNDVPFTPDDLRAAARLLQAVRGRIGPALSAMGFEIPAPPEPVTPRATTSGTPGTAPMAVRMLADGRIEVSRVPYSMKDTMEAVPGREHSRAKPGPLGHVWYFPGTPASAAGLLRTLAPFAPACSPRVTALADEHVAAQAAAVVLSDDAPAPDYDGAGHVNMSLWAHQARFVEFGTVSKALCFAVKMGGGKTGGTIALVNRTESKRILIVCPNKVRRVWVREARERSSVMWHIADGTRPKRVGKGRMNLPQPERVAQANHVLFDCDCDAPVHAYVVNYEAMTEPVWQRWEMPARLDMVIWDEGHKLKAPASRIKRKVKGVDPLVLAERAKKGLAKFTTSGLAAEWRGNAERAVALTGTPFPQHPWDIFGLYRALDPGIFGTAWSPFEDEYLELDRSKTFPKRIKPDKLAEFAAKCMSIMYRPTVDLKLPGITDVLRVVELEPAARRHYDQLDAELWTDLTLLLEQQRRKRLGLPEALADDGGEGSPTELTVKNILGRLLRLQQLTGGTLRGDPIEGPDGKPIPGPEVRVSWAKAEELADILEGVGCTRDNPDGAEPVIVFTRFTPDLDAVREVAEKAGLRYGEISGRRSDGLNEDARMSEDHDVVGVNIQAGGTGIDLTRACHAVWYSLGYSVSDYDQARARLYRPGQRRPVVNIHLQAEDTQDEAVYDAIDQRRAAIGEVLTAGGVTPEEVAELVPLLTRGTEWEAEAPPAPDSGDVDTHSEDAVLRLPWELP